MTSPTGAQPRARAMYLACYYDPPGRLTATADYGAITSFTRPAAPPARSDDVLVTNTEYNDAGQAVATIDPAGRIARRDFDAAGRVTRTIQDYVDGVIDAAHPDEDVTVAVTYTLDGQIATLTAVNPTTGDQVTRYVYGTTLSDSGVARADLLRAEIYPDSDDTTSLLGDGPDGIHDRIEYRCNRLGQLIEKKDQNGTVHVYSYDKLGRLTRDSVPILGSEIDGSVRAIGRTFTPSGAIATLIRTAAFSTTATTPASITTWAG